MTDTANCHYAVLGLTKEATTAEIKKAYRKLALEFHPDKVQGEEAKEAASKKFQKVNEAYNILSDEERREEYDDKIKLMELRKRSKGEANISIPRTPTATHYDVRYAEPRPDTYRTKSSSRAPPVSTTKIYAQYQPSSSRSYEEDIYAARHYEEASRSARRTQSYDEKPSKREDEQRERDRRRRAEDREEKERLIRALEKKEKEKLRAEKELKQKKQRKKEAEEKRSHRDVYSYDDDEPVRSSKSDKKKSSSSSSKKHEIRERERSNPREIVAEEAGVPDKSAHFMMAAAQYINASRSKAAPNQPSLSRSNTYQDYGDRYAQIPPVAVPTPPTAQEAPFAPPTVEEATDEDRPYRSSAKPSARRSSDTPKSRDKSTHKKSSSGPKEYVEAIPIGIDPPTSRHIPSFAKAGSTPPRVPDSPPHHHKLARAHTMKEEAARSPPVPPGISRSSTYHYPAEYSSRETREPRGRDRSRLQPQVLSEEEDSEDDRRYESSRRAERRHRTRSPEIVPMPADYPHARGGSAYRYHVKEGRAVPMAAPVDPYYYPEDSSPPSRKSKSATYYQPYGRPAEVRPSMPSRDSAYSSSGSYMPSKIKTQQSYTPNDVQYSYREPATSWA